VRQWFPSGSTDNDGSHVLVRTASTSSLDWARAPSAPLTLSARFTYDSARRPGLAPVQRTRTSADYVLVDISPDATVGELKVAVLLAAGRPAPAGMLSGVTLWAVDVSEPELEAIEAVGGLARGSCPNPYPPHASGPIFLADENAAVRSYISNTRSNRTDPRSVSLSVYLAPSVVDELAPRNPVPRFQYPMPVVDAPPPPRRTQSRALPSVVLGSLDALDSPISLAAPRSVSSCGSGSDHSHEGRFESASKASLLAPPVVRCCGGGHEGLGLVGLGITMSPTPSMCDHESSDDEAPSWPPTPVVGRDEEPTWLGPSPTAPAWTPNPGAEPISFTLEEDEQEQALTPKVQTRHSLFLAAPPLPFSFTSASATRHPFTHYARSSSVA
jgi:hypothetical protein